MLSLDQEKNGQDPNPGRSLFMAKQFSIIFCEKTEKGTVSRDSY